MTKPDPIVEELRYEEIVEQLEAVTDQLASGAVGIEAAADLYERAGRLHAAASARLDAVRHRLDTLEPPSDDGGDPGS